MFTNKKNPTSPHTNRWNRKFGDLISGTSFPGLKKFIRIHRHRRVLFVSSLEFAFIINNTRWQFSNNQIGTHLSPLSVVLWKPSQHSSISLCFVNICGLITVLKSILLVEHLGGILKHQFFSRSVYDTSSETLTVITYVSTREHTFGPCRFDETRTTNIINVVVATVNVQMLEAMTQFPLILGSFCSLRSYLCHLCLPIWNRFNTSKFSQGWFLWWRTNILHLTRVEIFSDRCWLSLWCWRWFWC